MQYAKHFIGIDVSKSDFYASFNETKTSIRFSNNHIGVKKFMSFLKTNKFDITNTLIGIESTSRYHLPICILCTRKNYNVKLINPLITKRQTSSSIRGVKTDKSDARVVRYCLINGAGYIFKDNKENMVLKNLVRQRYFLVSVQADLKRKQLDMVYKEKYLGVPITDINYELALILKQKINKIESELEEYDSQTQKLLQTIPGIGKITAACFVAEIGDINKFAHPKQLVGFIGIDPRVHESGETIKKKGYITKRGTKVLRKTLYNAAMTAMQKPNLFRNFYNKKLSEGKPKKVCLVAVMRKMVHVVFSVWKNKKAFETRKKNLNMEISTF